RRGGAIERMESTGLPVGLLSGRGHTEQTARIMLAFESELRRVDPRVVVVVGDVNSTIACAMVAAPRRESARHSPRRSVRIRGFMQQRRIGRSIAGEEYGALADPGRAAIPAERCAVFIERNARMLQTQTVKIGAAAGGSDQIVEAFLNVPAIDLFAHHDLVTLALDSKNFSTRREAIFSGVGSVGGLSHTRIGQRADRPLRPNSLTRTPNRPSA
ncbi:MAG: hypothetical protein HC788_10235, partial [Sphingopyxis sp.]|nr:hypothetical protein [Sphingopyxis sp.]